LVPQAELDESKRASLAKGCLRSNDGDVREVNTFQMGSDTLEEVGVGLEGPSADEGFAFGKAPDGAKPQSGLSEPSRRVSEVRAIQEGGSAGSTQLVGSIAASRQTSHPDRQNAFVQFKQSEGASATQRLLQAKKDLKEYRSRRSSLAVQVNQAKRQIDIIKVQLDRKKTEREAVAQTSEDEADIIDEEEYAFIQQCKAAKKTYKEFHETLVMCNAALDACSSEVDSARQNLLKSFDDWFVRSFTMVPDEIVTQVAGSTISRDAMDDDEQFEQMQMDRVMAEKPESLAFVRARKSVRSRKR